MSRVSLDETPDLATVIVVGDLVTDVLAVPSGPIAAGTDTPARVRIGGGGQAGNTAAWLAYAGVPVTLVAAVGDDPAGRDRVAELTAAGVDCAVRSVAGVPTGTLVVLASGSDRSMLTDRGAADHLRSSDVDAALDRHAGGHLHLSGYTLLGEGSRAAGRHALATARARGLSTSVDAASVAPLQRVGTDAFLDWIQGVDLLLANADEAALLGAHPGAAIVVTHDPDGAVWSTGSVSVRVDSVPAAAVDSTGAGDAFAAGLLATWLSGGDPVATLRAGAELAAQAVTRHGARP